jgi:hypothetical protein
MNLENNSRQNFKDKCPGYPYLPSVYKLKKRIVVLGDIHGDFKYMIESLKIGKVINKNNINEWTGGKTFVVQVGDQLDSKRNYEKNNLNKDEMNDIKVLKYLTDLDKKARLVGGRVISLLGNHEIFNVQGYMDYVSKYDLQDFTNNFDNIDNLETYNNALMERRNKFRIGNEYSKYLACTRQAYIIIGNYLFIHGGITSQFMVDFNITDQTSLEKLNDEVRGWLLGKIDDVTISSLLNSGKDSNSVFWTRILGSIPSDIDLLDENKKKENDEICKDYVKKVLDVIKIDKIIIGHTPQFIFDNKNINSACGKKIWRVDIGGSQAFDNFDNDLKTIQKKLDGRKVRVLEINNNDNEEIIKILE